MVFKLVMPRVDPLMKGGVVSKWHKTEGDRVDYGEDLFDVSIELTMPAFARSFEHTIRLLKEGGTLRDKGVAVDRTIILVARVTSSDVGILRRIETKEGAYRDVGSLLAILSSEQHGSADLLAEAEASEFRIVTNLAES